VHLVLVDLSLIYWGVRSTAVAARLHRSSGSILFVSLSLSELIFLILFRFSSDQVDFLILSVG
jgi:hypothetical protein